MTKDSLIAFSNVIKRIEKLSVLPIAILTKPIKVNKWSVRDIVSHLYYWDKYNLEKMVPNMANQATLAPFPNLDLHNQKAIEFTSKFSVEEIFDAFVSTRSALTAKLASIDETLSFYIENEPGRFTADRFITIFLEHDHHHLSQIDEFLKSQTFKVEAVDGFSPQIGHLVSMMNYARYTTLNEVKGLSKEELDYLAYPASNSIGALLLHMAAVEIGFQIEIFDGRAPNEQEIEEWGAAYSLGEQGRITIKGQPMEFYLKKLETVRKRTFEEFKKRDDSWLYEQRLWDNNLSNTYFIWYHVMEDELNHRGQIRILKKMLPKE
jgi:uncharacterized damage-inducible protein DinB